MAASARGWQLEAVQLPSTGRVAGTETAFWLEDLTGATSRDKHLLQQLSLLDVAMGGAVSILTDKLCVMCSQNEGTITYPFFSEALCSDVNPIGNTFLSLTLLV